MTSVAPRQSPMHDALAELGPAWSQVRGMPIALHFGDSRAQAQRAQTLGLCDLTALPRIGIKGAGAESWLAEHGASIPASIYTHHPLKPGGLIVRPGAAEFFIEDGPSSEWVARLTSDANRVPPAVYRFAREDAAIV